IQYEIAQSHTIFKELILLYLCQEYGFIYGKNSDPVSLQKLNALTGDADLGSFASFSSPSFCLTTLVYTAPSSPVLAAANYKNNYNNAAKAAAEDKNDATEATEAENKVESNFFFFPKD
ncbi:hypothetical protein HK096_010891, partial [Nowakowskiella sp. JEL0078]